MRYAHRSLALLLLLVFLALPSVALAGRSPAGVVDDRADTLSEQQLRNLDRTLAGLRFPYRVVILDRAFPDSPPADAQAQLAQVAQRLLVELPVPRDGILITVAMKERLVDFRTFKEGPVNEIFRTQKGADFGTFTGPITESFRQGAASGGVEGAIIGAVRAMEGMLAPPQTGTGNPSAPSSPSPPSPEAARGFLWWLLGALGLTGLLLLGLSYRRYRQAQIAALRVRDAFLGDLLGLMQRELPLAEGYAGAQTRAAAELTAAAADKALQAQQAGEEHQVGAQRLAHRLRFRAAASLMQEAEAAFQQGADAFVEARKAWEPVAFALRNWDVVQGETERALSEAAACLAAGQSRTSWPLSALEGRLQEARATASPAGERRRTDPVEAVSLLRQAASVAQAVQADLERLPELEKAYQAATAHRQEAEGAVATAKASLGLRFVEASPDAALGRALERERAAGLALPVGDVATAQSALEGAEAGVAEALRILEQYREALAKYPEQSAELNRELPTIGDEALASRSLREALRRAYDQEDWADLADLPERLAALQSRSRDGLDQAAGLTSPAVQRYLEATALLGGLLAERADLGSAFATLKGRPAQLEALANQAKSDLDAARQEVSAAEGLISGESLRLSAALATEYDQVRRELQAVSSLNETRPLPANRVAQAAQRLLPQARGFHSAVEEQARLAAAARAEVALAHQRALAAMAYEAHDRGGYAGSLRHSLMAADAAMAEGQYDFCLAQAEMALRCCRGLEDDYQSYLDEQAEAERRAREAASASSSGDGGSWSSSSSSDSSGGGGSWDSGSSSSSDNSSTGGGGSW